MVCSFADPDKIKEWIEICSLMKEMGQVVCFLFSPTELRIQMKHPSNRSILDMTFPSAWFSFYDWKETELYLYTRSLWTIFSRYSGEKIISMESEKKHLLIKCFHEKQNKNFSIPLLYDPQKIIHVHCDPGIEVTVDPSFFHTLCKELHAYDNLVYFHVKKEFFHMISRREEKMVVEVQPMMLGGELPDETKYENTFELVYLLLFLKCSSLYPSMKVHLSNLLSFTLEKEYTLHYYVCSTKS